MTEVSIKGPLPTDPRQRVLMIEAMAKTICQSVGEDPADCVMALMTAACHLTAQHGGRSSGEQIDKLAYVLGCATAAADDFFKLRSTRPAGRAALSTTETDR